MNYRKKRYIVPPIILTLTVLSMIGLLSIGGGTGQAVESQGAGTPAQQTPSEYLLYDSDESVITLLEDSSVAMEQKLGGVYGVHFTDNFTLSVEGAVTNAYVEGDVLPPGRVSLSAEVHEPYREYSGEPPILFDAILIEKMIYIKPDFSRKWFAFDFLTNEGKSPLEEDMEDMDFTKSVVNPVFLGQEKTPAGAPVYHIRFEIDAATVAEEIKKNISPNVDPEIQKEIDKLDSSVITQDMWIGVNDLLIYQVTERFVNAELGLAYDDMIMFYAWGEQIEISPPPAEDTIDCRCPESEGVAV